MEDIISDAAGLLGLNVVLWLISLHLGKTWPVDFIWSTWPCYQCVVILARGAAPAPTWRALVTCVLVAVWGWRLTLNFIVRGGIGHEDWRYADMRTQFGRHFWWASLFTVFLGQTVFIFAPCLSLYAALSPGGAPLSALDALGVGCAAAGILLEAASDTQMDAFQAARREKRTDAKICDRGLWRYSRHPNYLGELMWWWGVYALAVAAGAAAWVVVGPVLITLLFLGVSIKLMEDRQLKNKGEAYEAYRRAVPSSLVPLPTSCGRASSAQL